MDKRTKDITMNVFTLGLILGVFIMIPVIFKFSKTEELAQCQIELQEKEYVTSSR